MQSEKVKKGIFNIRKENFFVGEPRDHRTYCNPRSKWVNLEGNPQIIA